MTETKLLGLPILAADGTDFVDIPELWNDGTDKLEKAVADITYFMNAYSYTWSMSEADTGALTITVTLGEDCPVSASMTAVISEGDSGETVVDVTTVIDGVTTKSQHTINDNGGKGGPING